MKKEDNYFLKEYVKKIGSVKDDYESKSIYRYERNKKIKILKNLLKNTNDNILDFGCSNGSYFDIIKDLNFQKIFGLDLEMVVTFQKFNMI